MPVASGYHLASAEELIEKYWPSDRAAAAVLRAAVTPTDTTALASTAITSFVAGLQPASAAARLIAAGVVVSLAGLATVSVPRATSRAQPSFVAEASPIVVGESAFAAEIVGPSRKLALIEGATGELADHSAPNVL
jgi:hypothetical protein